MPQVLQLYAARQVRGQPRASHSCAHSGRSGAVRIEGRLTEKELTYRVHAHSIERAWEHERRIIPHPAAEGRAGGCVLTALALLAPATLLRNVRGPGRTPLGARLVPPLARVMHGGNVNATRITGLGAAPARSRKTALSIEVPVTRRVPCCARRPAAQHLWTRSGETSYWTYIGTEGSMGTRTSDHKRCTRHGANFTSESFSHFSPRFTHRTLGQASTRAVMPASSLR
ncbi:hypothetical protein BD413DRAFT_292805 [Trametes elegans]|nr:hypothetical protein BD413DRAFT_292805 [Trametes elegans]